MNKKRWLWLPAKAVQNTLLAAAIATLAIYMSTPNIRYVPEFTPFYALETNGYDLLFTLRGPKLDRLDPRIMVVGIDRQAEVDMGAHWPFPRRYDAAAIRNIAKDGASMIVYDVLFSDPTNEKDDKDLDDALKHAGNVVLSMRIDRDPDTKRESLEEPYYNDDEHIDFLSNAVDGFAEVPQDNDNVVRRFSPIMYFQDQPLPSMSAAAYLKLKGLDLHNLVIKPAAIQVGDVYIPRSGPTIRDPFHEKYLIPSALMDFPAANATFPLDISFSNVVNGKFPKGTFRGKIVFVGRTGSEITRENFDEFITAYSNHTPDPLPNSSIGWVNQVPGVFVQAMNFNALVHNGFVTNMPLWAVWILVFGLTIVGAVAVRSSFNWRGPAILVLCVLLYIVYAVEVFGKLQIYVPWVVPSLLMFTSVALVTYFERGALRRKWSGYVSPQVLETILKGTEEVAAQRYRASVVFGDIRGFTSFTTMHTPEVVVKLLNMHFERMTKIIYEEQGTIDKFFGDGVMVLFGAPVALKDQAVYAVRAAWRMCEAAKEPLVLDGEAYVLSSGFGVTTGWLVAGHVGSKMRHDYTVIGDIVNLSSRLQGVTGAPDVVLDTTTLHLVKDFVEVMPLGEVFIKGLAEHMECFRVVAWIGDQGGKRKKRKAPETQKAGISR